MIHKSPDQIQVEYKALQSEVKSLRQELDLVRSQFNMLYELESLRKEDEHKLFKVALESGLKVLGMEVGIISQITGRDYRIVESVGAKLTPRLAKGERFGLFSTFCQYVNHSGWSLFQSDISKSQGWNSLTFHQEFGFEAYYGVPIVLEGKVYGTMSFFSTKNLSKEIEAKQEEFLEMVAMTLQSRLIRQKATDQLKIAKETAEEAARTKAEFLSIMSHEIRTPMNAIMGFAHLLKDTPLDSEQMEFLGHIYSSSEALLVILNDILDLSKIEAGKLELEASPFDLVQTLEDTLEFLCLRAQEKNIELTSQIPIHLPRHVIGDSGRLRQILINLLGNALKFTAKGKVEIAIECLHSDSKQITVKIRVSDTGEGISPDAVARLFKPFSQADASVARKHGGTGLGLSICKLLSELMHGEIGVESTLGQGSCFWFTAQFPLQEVPQEPHWINQALQNLFGHKIAILAPNPYLQKSLQNTLEALGLEYHSFSSIDEILQAESTNFNHILIDYELIDNLDIMVLSSLQSQIRAKEWWFICPMGQKLDHHGLKISGNLTKPLKASSLIEKLSHVQISTTKIVKNQIIHSGHKILLVEDNPINQKLALKLLERIGYQATVAINGQDALLRIQEENWDLILMDLQMPIMDGFEATKHIRDGSCGDDKKSIPIVAMTANAMLDEIQHCRDIGIQDFVPKPIKPNQLGEVLTKFLGE